MQTCQKVKKILVFFYIITPFCVFFVIGILKQIENNFVIFSNNMINSFQKMEKRIDRHLGSNLLQVAIDKLNKKIYITGVFLQNSRFLDQYRSNQGESFPTEYVCLGLTI